MKPAQLVVLLASQGPASTAMNRPSTVMDHVILQAKGWWTNVVPACGHCNPMRVDSRPWLTSAGAGVDGFKPRGQLPAAPEFSDCN